MMMKRRRRSNETKTGNDSESLPEDLFIEILRRLPVKSLARFLLVSKLWSTIIRSPDFIRSFPFQSPSQPPRLLFGLNNFDLHALHHWNFYLSPSSSSTQEIPFLSRTKRQMAKLRVNYVNGLISCRYGQQQIITNPSTGKSITLPKVKTREEMIKSFFGYDPVDCQYKVLCMSGRARNTPSSDHQVFTLGAEGGRGKFKQSWRMVECNTLHCPKSNGLCINGVLYYGAFTGIKVIEWCLMRFDVRTEKLNLLSRINENVSYLGCRSSPSLINYQGKVTLAFQTSRHTFDLWVMGQDADKWSKVSFSIHPWRDLFDNEALRITGTIHTGEIILVPYNRRSTCGVVHYPIVFYDHKRNELRLRTVKVDLGNLIEHCSLMVPFFNYVESAMLL